MNKLALSTPNAQDLGLRIALLIPTHNSSATIRQTLQSVMDQSHCQGMRAIFIADDHSIDDTLAIVRATWKSTVPLQVLESNGNRGERENVNRAVNVIRDYADWILILHSDDVAKPNWLTMLLHRINACDDGVASICSSWDNWMPDGSINLGEDNPDRAIEVIPGNVSAVIGTLMRGCWWHISGCAIRIKAFQGIGGFDPGMPQLGDWDWLLRCLAAGWSVEYVPRSLILYRQHHTSVSSASFRIDRDIRESLGIIDRYSHLLSATELLHWHIRRSVFCIRRLARALTCLDFGRLYLGLQTVALVFQTYLRVQKNSRKRRLSET